MIIATGTLNIDENTKLAQQASDDAKNAGNSAADEANKIKTSLDGKITTSSQAPFDDGVNHSDGDIWYVQGSDHNTTAMYTYDGLNWNQTKMTTSTMSVGQLSALNADLGNIKSGCLDSVEINSSTIKAGTIDADSTITGSTIKGANIDATSTITGASIKGASINGGSISGSSLSITNNNTNYWLDQNGLHVQYYANDEINGANTQKNVWVHDSGLSISMSEYSVDIQPEQIKMSGGGGKGTIWSTNINWPAITISDNIQIDSKHIIHSIDYGALFFEGGSDGGEDGIDIHAGGVYSHGTNLLDEINHIKAELQGKTDTHSESPDEPHDTHSESPDEPHDTHSESPDKPHDPKKGSPDEPHDPKKESPDKPHDPKKKSPDEPHDPKKGSPDEPHKKKNK